MAKKQKDIAARRNLIGPRLRQKRRELDLTQEQLAERITELRMTQNTITKIETGYREVTDREVVALAQALGVAAGWLLGEDQK